MYLRPLLLLTSLILPIVCDYLWLESYSAPALSYGLSDVSNGREIRAMPRVDAYATHCGQRRHDCKARLLYEWEWL